ncbi:hypothetical protein PVAND_016676 [Polypedilum vanderplanki]|uniref:Tetratricopeptide repeat protein n=1 Tax=Polypedilum vanderplanki TaxID=319348 RepID=A0A9J6BG42_POLVA|nr:hypothetical protein PVAND_016676 [Polypedilum vanderplanki]
MSKLTDFTDDFLLLKYPNIARDEEIEIFDIDGFICLSFKTISDPIQLTTDSVDGQAQSLKSYDLFERRKTTGNIDTRMWNFKSASLKRVSKNYENFTTANLKDFLIHKKFFDKVTGIFLGNSKEKAVEKSASLGIENFLTGNLNEAKRLFNCAYKNSDINSETEKHYKDLLDITKLVIEADDDLNRKKFSNCVINMQNAYIDCNHPEMKMKIAEIRNEKAEKFFKMAENYASEGNEKVAMEFYKLTYKICTPDHPRKDDFKKKIVD